MQHVGRWVGGAGGRVRGAGWCECGARSGDAAGVGGALAVSSGRREGDSVTVRCAARRGGGG